jgi:hypothetical protein
MSPHQYLLQSFVLLSAVTLLAMLWPASGMTGALTSCPAGHISAGEYCVEKACQNKQVKCLKEGQKIKRPDCHCTAYSGKFVCGIKGGERTATKLPTCTRRGQLNTVCGAYDSVKRQCVLK